MNIQFPLVDRRSQLSSHILTAFAICMAVMLVLSLARHIEIRWSIPYVSVQTAQTQHNDMPIAVPAPLPPAEATNAISTPEPDGNTMSTAIPQVIPAPAPSVP